MALALVTDDDGVVIGPVPRVKVIPPSPLATPELEPAPLVALLDIIAPHPEPEPVKIAEPVTVVTPPLVALLDIIAPHPPVELAPEPAAIPKPAPAIERIVAALPQPAVPKELAPMATTTTTAPKPAAIPAAAARPAQAKVVPSASAASRATVPTPKAVPAATPVPARTAAGTAAAPQGSTPQATSWWNRKLLGVVPVWIVALAVLAIGGWWLVKKYGR